MFNCNQFKRDVKEWMRLNPKGTVEDLVDFCEEQIPPNQFSSYEWLVDQTVGWYKHVLAHREITQRYNLLDDQAMN